jgi:tetratricopeptide (TPR) repeat protein
MLSNLRMAALTLVAALAVAGSAKADFSACESGYQERDLHEKIRLYTICITKGGLGRTDRAGALVNRGVAHETLGEYDQAFADFDRSIAENPDGGWGHLNRGQLHAARGQWTLARDDFETAGRIAFKSQIRAAAYGHEALLLATCPDPAIRDKARALELASKAVKLDGRSSNHEGLAAALAANGRFGEALAEQSKAIELARKENRADLAGLEQRLELLRKTGSEPQPRG